MPVVFALASFGLLAVTALEMIALAFSCWWLEDSTARGAANEAL
jgi:hypothetical protein